jgi:hypothetical protein
MERLLLFMLIILSQAILHCAGAQDVSSLEWGRPITYSDFESQPNESDTAAANISVSILLGYVNTKSNILRFKVVAVMDKDESWIRKGFKQDHILKHEQGHFDIAQIFARKLEDVLKKRFYTPKDVKALNALYDEYLNRMNEVEVRYDEETRGGWDPVAQSKWRRYIAEELGTDTQ